MKQQKIKLLHDDKLRRAMKEVNQVMQKYNLMGYCALASSTHSEFLLDVHNATWSLIKIERAEGDAMAYRIKYDAFDIDKLQATVHGICSISDLARKASNNLESLIMALSGKMEIQRTSLVDKDPDSIPGVQ